MPANMHPLQMQQAQQAQQAQQVQAQQLQAQQMQAHMQAQYSNHFGQAESYCSPGPGQMSFHHVMMGYPGHHHPQFYR